MADGANVLTRSSQSVVGAIGVAKSDKVAWFGTQWDQSSLAPSEVVSCQVYNWVPVLEQTPHGYQGREARRRHVHNLARQQRREDRL